MMMSEALELYAGAHAYEELDALFRTIDPQLRPPEVLARIGVILEMPQGIIRDDGLAMRVRTCCGLY